MVVWETILPILILALSGYMVAKLRYLSQLECDCIAKFVFSYAIPSLLFISSAQATLPNDMNWQFLFAYYIVVLVMYALSTYLGKRLFAYNVPQQSVFAMGTCYSNATIIGIPICSYALGEKALLPLFIIISIHNLSLFTLGTLVAERDNLSFSSFLQSVIKLLKQLIRHPITASLILGGCINLAEIKLYAPLHEAISLMGDAAIPSALFALGMLLNKYKIQGNIAPALLMATFKVVLFPFLVWVLVFQVFTIDPLWASTALLVAAMPVGLAAYIFAIKYQQCEALLASAIVISTLASMLTLTLVLMYIHALI